MRAPSSWNIPPALWLSSRGAPPALSGLLHTPTSHVLKCFLSVIRLLSSWCSVAYSGYFPYNLVLIPHWPWEEVSIDSTHSSAIQASIANRLWCLHLHRGQGPGSWKCMEQGWWAGYRRCPGRKTLYLFLLILHLTTVHLGISFGKFCHKVGILTYNKINLILD